MRNTAAHNTPAHAATLAQPMEWPFRNRSFFCWSDVYPEYSGRMSAIADDYLHWSLLI